MGAAGQDTVYFHPESEIPGCWAADPYWDWLASGAPSSLLLGSREERQSTCCAELLWSCFTRISQNKSLSFLIPFFLALLWGLWDLSSLTRGWTRGHGRESAASLPLGHPTDSLFLSLPLCQVIFYTFSFMQISLSLSFIIFTQLLSMYFMNLFVFAHEVMFYCLPCYKIQCAWYSICRCVSRNPLRYAADVLCSERIWVCFCQMSGAFESGMTFKQVQRLGFL